MTEQSYPTVKDCIKIQEDKVLSKDQYTNKYNGHNIYNWSYLSYYFLKIKEFIKQEYPNITLSEIHVLQSSTQNGKCCQTGNPIANAKGKYAWCRILVNKDGKTVLSPWIMMPSNADYVSGYLDADECATYCGFDCISNLMRNNKFRIALLCSINKFPLLLKLSMYIKKYYKYK